MLLFLCFFFFVFLLPSYLIHPGFTKVKAFNLISSLPLSKGAGRGWLISSRSRGWEELRTREEAVHRSQIQMRRTCCTLHKTRPGGGVGDQIPLLLMTTSSARAHASAPAGRSLPRHVLTFRPLVVQNAFEHVPTNVHRSLIRQLIFPLVHRAANSHAPENRLRTHFRREIPQL